jgi:hypothetical protein
MGLPAACQGVLLAAHFSPSQKMAARTIEVCFETRTVDVDDEPKKTRKIVIAYDPNSKPLKCGGAIYRVNDVYDIMHQHPVTIERLKSTARARLEKNPFFIELPEGVNPLDDVDVKEVLKKRYNTYSIGDKQHWIVHGLKRAKASAAKPRGYFSVTSQDSFRSHTDASVMSASSSLTAKEARRQAAKTRASSLPLARILFA